MDIRPIAFFLGMLLIIGSYWWGDWTLWIGGPLVFLAAVFHFIDKE